MPNAARLDLVYEAIRAGTTGNVQWQDAAARRARAQPGLQGLTPEGIVALLRRFVLDGEELDARSEAREEHLELDPENPWWYRAIIPVPGLTHGLFVELKQVDDDPENPWVEIVNVHPQLT